MPTVEQMLADLEAKVKEIRLDLRSLHNSFMDWREKVSNWQSGLGERRADEARQAEEQKRKERRRK